MIRRFIFHNKISISSLKYIRNPKSYRSSKFETLVVISTRVIAKLDLMVFGQIGSNKMVV